jgi:CRISPR/Cas system-associated exonuclease Cas4 (RecB family)
MSDPSNNSIPTVDPDGPQEIEGLQDIVRNQVKEAVSNRSFNEWYQERQFEENILDGKPYFNGPSPPPDPERHSPSQLTQCHRKISYRKDNAPQEGASPDGLFWLGTQFEERIAVPYLQAVATTDETYVRNSIWIDVNIDVGDETLRLKGTTDPVITDADGDPLLVTEIKSTSSLDHLSSPKPHHKAQLHAYLYGLTREYDYVIHDGLVLYGSRKTMDVKAFHVPFDESFWRDTVVEWMRNQTEYREAESLPPADPSFGWECNFCSYRNRCGQADTPYKDYGPVGLLPVFTEYREAQLVEYLDAYADAEAKLTPALANEFTELASEYGSYDWRCTSCGSSFAWDAVNGDDSEGPPVCPVCIEQGDFVTLSGPEPDDQLIHAGQSIS